MPQGKPKEVEEHHKKLHLVAAESRKTQIVELPWKFLSPVIRKFRRELKHQAKGKENGDNLHLVPAESRR